MLNMTLKSYRIQVKNHTPAENLKTLIAYFQSRYEKLANILVKRPELKNYTKVADIEEEVKAI